MAIQEPFWILNDVKATMTTQHALYSKVVCTPTKSQKLFMVWIHGSKINCTQPQYDLPQYKEVSTIHLLKYSTSYHKIYSKFVTTYITFKTSTDCLVKNAFYSIAEFLSAGQNNVDGWTFIFNLFYYVVMHIVALSVVCIWSFLCNLSCSY